jgi:hypothetical protein
MPLYFIIAIACGAVTVGATATDAKRWVGPNQSALAAAFDASAYASVSDCLTAAAGAGAPLSACPGQQ